MANLGYIQITRACNQNCRFCSNPDTGKNTTLKQAKKIISGYKKLGYMGVIFTGGEPTLHEELPEMISFAQEKGISARLITNGQKLSDKKYLEKLKKRGLKHIMLSVHSFQRGVQDNLSNNQGSLANIKKSLKNIESLDLWVDIIIVINKYNSSHLSGIVEWLLTDYPFIKHFVWNNLDPLNNKASKNIDTIPRLNDFELELHKAMVFLQKKQKTFRVERVPLCYMSGFEQFSTETRKIVKNEERAIYFLDDKGYVTQKGKEGFLGYKKADCCGLCFLDSICPGLYAGGSFYSFSELYPLFVDKKMIIKKVLAK